MKSSAYKVSETKRRFAMVTNLKLSFFFSSFFWTVLQNGLTRPNNKSADKVSGKKQKISKGDELEFLLLLLLLLLVECFAKNRLGQKQAARAVLTKLHQRGEAAAQMVHSLLVNCAQQRRHSRELLRNTQVRKQL